MIGDWGKRVIGEAISSKKTLATCGAIVFLTQVNQKYALIAFVVWMVCQTAIDVSKILKGKKE